MGRLMRPSHTFQCDGCGRFVKHSEIMNKGGGASWCEVPSTPFTYEEDKLHCKRCTKQHGPPTSTQSIDSSRCTGVY